jgi:ABC-type uncharacterized transport system permease subunit
MDSSQWLKIGLNFSAFATLLYVGALSSIKFSKSLQWLAHFCLVGVCLSLSLAAFGRYDSAVWTSGAPLLLALFITWFAVFGIFISKIRRLGLLASPLITGLLMIHQFFVPSAQLFKAAVEQVTAQYVGGFHVLSAVGGEAFFALSAGAAGLYLLQQRALRKRNWSTALLQPIPLDRLELIMVIGLWAGFILLTIALLLGASFVQMFLVESPHGLIIKTIWAVTAWVWYFGILYVRYVFRRSPTVMARLLLYGFVLLAMALFGVGFLRPLGGA